MAQIKAIRGFKDILPGETEKWQHAEEKARQVFARFGVKEIKIPILEKTELFKRGIGETTDIVEKEMYTFSDRGDESLTLRPEATASVIRAYLEHHLYSIDPLTKLYTIGPMFRRERPQKGRFRQFHQINVEVLGEEDPQVDSELIFMLIHFLQELGLIDINLEINSLGCPSCRMPFREKIIQFLQDKEEYLCNDCKRRLHTNPLRVFDCKVESCGKLIADAPVMLDFLCRNCENHFETVKDYLAALQISFHLNPRMVRGLDYYTKTAFEITTTSLGAQNSVAGGGRYDNLVKMLGGPDIPGIGFAIGLERLLALIPDEQAFASPPHLFIAALGTTARRAAVVLGNALRTKGLMVETDVSDKSLKSQMKRSNKLNCFFTMIIGEKELEEQKAPLRNMQDGTQFIVDLTNEERLVQTIYKQLPARK